MAMLVMVVAMMIMTMMTMAIGYENFCQILASDEHRHILKDAALGLAGESGA